MAISRGQNPSPERCSVLSYMGPGKDLLFWEKVDAAKASAVEAEYGTPHWDARNYPDHRLVYVAPLDQGGQWFQFYYAAKRESQDLYNWEFSEADIAGNKFSSVKRTYLIPRSEYSGDAMAMGTPMENIPANTFFSAYILSQRKQQSAPRELESLFILEERTFIKRVPLIDVTMDEVTGQAIRKVTRFYYRGEFPPDSLLRIEELFADITHPFWGLQDDTSRVTGETLSDNWFAVVSESPHDELLDILIQTPGTTNINFPPQIKAASGGVVWNKIEGIGSGERSSMSAASGTRGSMGVGGTVSASSSISIMPELNFHLETKSGSNIPTTNYYFFAKTANGRFTPAMLYARLSDFAVSAIPMPQWTLKSGVFVLRGQKKSCSLSVSAENNASYSEGSASASVSEGMNDDYDVSNTVTVIKVPPCIGYLSYNQTSEIVAGPTVSVTASAVSAGGSSGNVSLPAISKTKSVPLKVEGSVTGSAGSGMTNVNGTFIINSRVSPHAPGWVSCSVEIAYC